MAINIFVLEAIKILNVPTPRYIMLKLDPHSRDNIWKQGFEVLRFYVTP
jgi:hypothetical protein